MSIIIDLLKNIVLKYELKHPIYEKPKFICTNFDCRNKAKNNKYKIPNDKPQCPIFNDNRCCGGCSFASNCDHCVNCNCFGFTKGQMGGTDEKYYLNKASKFYELGRIGKDGNFDWNYYYYFNKKKQDIIPNKYIIFYDRIYKIKTKCNDKGNFKAISNNSRKIRTININDLGNYIITYDNIEKLKLFNKLEGNQTE